MGHASFLLTSAAFVCTSSRPVHVVAGSVLPLSLKLKPITTFVIPSFCDARLGWSHVLAVVSHASVNICVQLCAWRKILSFHAGHLEVLEISLERK